MAIILAAGRAVRPEHARSAHISGAPATHEGILAKGLLGQDRTAVADADGGVARIRCDHVRGQVAKTWRARWRPDRLAQGSERRRRALGQNAETMVALSSPRPEH